ncbi:hypothetical protein KC723_00270 [Candidatus Kaiserbacteria bacterium]|nr:hypothetical protein [Candidatus Kaiserbacteria bacterium]
MNPTTKKVFIFSLVYFSVSLVVLGLIVFEVKRQGNNMVSDISLINQNVAFDQAQVSLQKLLNETKEDRAVINDMFLDNKRQINFLSDLENTADQFNLENKIISLDLSDKTDNPYQDLSINMEVIGEYSQVKKYIELIELIPLHSKVVKLVISNEEGSVWKAVITFTVTTLSV